MVAAVQLVAFDLDGTLVRGETCVEAIARRIGRSEECAAFQRLDASRDVESVTAARETMAEWYPSLPGRGACCRTARPRPRIRY